MIVCICGFLCGFAHQTAGGDVLEHLGNIQSNGFLDGFEGLQHGSGSIPGHGACSALAEENNLVGLAQGFADGAGDQLFHPTFEIEQYSFSDF